MDKSLNRLKLNFIRPLVTVFSLLFLAQAGACEIDIYSYVEPDDVSKVYRYESITEAALPEMKLDDFIGSYTYTPMKSEVTQGEKTLTVDVTQEGLPDYFPTDYPVYYIQKPGKGYYSAVYSDSGKELEEYLIIPECVEIGSSWKSGSFAEKEELISQGAAKLPTGYSFDNCLITTNVGIERTKASKKVGERQTFQTVRCEGIGVVSTTTTNTINAVNFQTVTTMVLESHKPVD